MFFLLKLYASVWLIMFRQNILATLAYYDVFDWPLKIGEILTKLVKIFPADIKHTTYNLQLKTIQTDLDQLVLDRMVDFADGFYFLAGYAPLETDRPKAVVAVPSAGRFLTGREHLVPLRLKREKIAKRKWRLARRAVWWLRFVPYVRAVFASGSLAMRDTDELSDLDVLIVVKHGRIWLARFFVLAALSLLRMRRKAGDKVAPDKICPNHFITDKSLRIPFKSIYTAQTYANLIPIYIDGQTLIEEFKKANEWVLDYVIGWNFGFVEVKPQQKVVEPLKRGSTTKLWELLLDHSGLGHILENWSRRYQSWRIARNPMTRNHAAGHVMFNDGQLAFHPDSIEKEIIDGYNGRLAQFGLSELAAERDSGLNS